MTLPGVTTQICLTAGAAEYEAADTFTRADSTATLGTSESGRQWFPAIGTSGIASNRAYFPTLVGGQGLAYLRTLAGGTLTVTLTTTAAHCGLVGRLRDSANYWLLRTNATNYKLELVVAGVATLKGTIAVTPANGDVLTLTLAGSTITAQVNATIGTPVLDSTFQDEPRAGIYAESTAARFDGFAGSFVWTDISAYVRQIGYGRGRQHELDTIQSGTAQVQLDARDRRFEPEYAAGAYYPFILPMRRVRVIATTGGVSYGRFYGFVERWPIQWAGPLGSELVTIEAVDKLAVAAYRLFDAYPTTVAGLNVYWYYRLGDSATSTADSGPNGFANATIVNGAKTFPGLLPALSGDDGALANVAGSTATVTWPNAAAPSGTNDFTIAGIFDASALATGFIWQLAYTGSAFVSVVSVPGLAVGQGLSFQVGSGNIVRHNEYRIDDVVPHHFAAVREGGVLSLYVDGSLSESAAFTADNITGVTSHTSTVPSAGSDVNHLDEMTMFSRALTSAEIAALAIASGVGRASGGQTTGQRVALVADLLGFSPASRSIDTGLSVMQASDLANQTPREHLNIVGGTEDGLIYTDGAGFLVFRDRNDPYTQITHDTWGDGGGTELPYEDLVPSYDIDRIYNDVRVQRTGSIVATAMDLTSQTRYQTRTLTKTVDHSTDTETQHQADWLLYRYKDPHLRFDQIVVKGWATNPAKVLDTEVGARLTVKRRPPGGGATLTADVIVEGLTETWSQDDWVTTWQLAPMPTVWVLGDPVYSVLGTTTVLGW